MNKEELFKKIAEVQDMIVSLYGCIESPQYCEEILMAANGLLDIKLEIEAYYRFIPEGA